MKKTGIALVLLFILSLPAAGTYNIMTRWQGDKAVLSIYGNYGHPLGEELRMRAEREKAFHIFNILESESIEADISIALHPFPPMHETDITVQELCLDLIGQELGIELTGEEEFDPAYDKGVLFYRKWSNGKMSLEFNGDLAVSPVDEAFEFHGKKGDNIIISRFGKLMYIDEVDWLEVKSLSGYTVSEARWLCETSILVRAEHDMTGRRYILKTSFRTDKEPQFSVEDPGFLDVAACADTGITAALTERRGARSILVYDPGKKQWDHIYTTPEVIYLAGVHGGEIIWWNAENEELHFSEGFSTRDVRHKTLALHPRGHYSWGEEELHNRATPEKITVILYGPAAETALEEKGLSGIVSFNSNPRVWLLHERYGSSFDELPDDLGYAAISPENMRIYYNTAGESLRRIRSVTLRPTLPTKYLLVGLIVVLLVLILYDALKKTKEIRS